MHYIIITSLLLDQCAYLFGFHRKKRRHGKHSDKPTNIYSSEQSMVKVIPPDQVNEQPFDNAIYSTSYQPPPVTTSPKLKRPPSGGGPNIEPPAAVRKQPSTPRRSRSRDKDYEHWTLDTGLNSESSSQNSPKPMHTSLDRAASLLKAKKSSSLQRRTESSAHLLDDDYDDIIITSSSSSSSSTNEINADYDDIIIPPPTIQKDGDYDDIIIPPPVTNQQDSDYDDIVILPKPLTNQSRDPPSVSPKTATHYT